MTLKFQEKVPDDLAPPGMLKKAIEVEMLAARVELNKMLDAQLAMKKPMDSEEAMALVINIERLQRLENAL